MLLQNQINVNQFDEHVYNYQQIYGFISFGKHLAVELKSSEL